MCYIYIYIRSGTFSQAAFLGNIVLQSYLASTTPITNTSIDKSSVSKSRSIDGCENVFSRSIDQSIVFFRHESCFFEDATDSRFEFSSRDALVLVCRHPRGQSRCVCYVTKQSLWRGASQMFDFACLRPPHLLMATSTSAPPRTSLRWPHAMVIP